MKLQGPNWDGRRVYQIRNAQLHAHNDGRITHVTNGEIFIDTEPITIHQAALICTEHWRIHNAAVEHPQPEGGPSHYGFDLEDCDDTCPTAWFYDVTDKDPVEGPMPAI